MALQQENDNNQQRAYHYVRINSKMISQHEKKLVSMVVKLNDITDVEKKGTILCTSPDMTIVGIRIMYKPKRKNASRYVEIKGRIVNGIIEAQTYDEWGNEFSFNQWNRLIELSKQFPIIFGDTK